MAKNKQKLPSASYDAYEANKRSGFKDTVKMFDPWPDRMPFNYGKGVRKHTSLIRAVMYIIAILITTSFSITRLLTMVNYENTLIQ